MTNSIERLPPPAPLIKAADHSTDHEHHGREQFPDPQKHEPKAEALHPEQKGQEEPAYVVDTHHVEQPQLDGVTAYQAAAQHAKQALGMRPEGADSLKNDSAAPVYSPAGVMPKAYVEHTKDEDEHKVNLAT